MSSARRSAREYALQACYSADLRSAGAGETLAELWSTLLDGEGIDSQGAPEAEAVAFAQRLAAGVAEQRDALDRRIEGVSTNWRISRMPVVDRNVLRLATYELVACPDVPATVAINEAIELAKRFGGADSRAFVNGVIDRVARQLDRLSGDRPQRPKKREAPPA